MRIDDLMHTLAEIRAIKGNLEICIYADLDFDHMIVPIDGIQVDRLQHDDHEKLVILAVYDEYEDDEEDNEEDDDDWYADRLLLDLSHEAIMEICRRKGIDVYTYVWIKDVGYKRYNGESSGVVYLRKDMGDKILPWETRQKVGEAGMFCILQLKADDPDVVAVTNEMDDKAYTR